MESAVISDESSDADMKTMKDQLSEFGLDEDNLSKEEMCDLLKALNNSKSTAKNDELLRVNPPKVEEDTDITAAVPEKSLKRRYLNVRDRRMPWSLLPSDISNAEKARVLAVYIKLMSINRYWQARQSAKFAAWPPPMQIVEETSAKALRSTRSGRSVPVYADLDDDLSDIDFVIAKPKKRKISSSDDGDGVYSNKVISLKRKPTKEDQKTTRPMKELKLLSKPSQLSEGPMCEASTSKVVAKGKRDLFSLIED